jgi:acyl carrier protein
MTESSVATERSDRAALGAQLRALLAEYAVEAGTDLSDDTPLISSGILESTTLLHVALWVEEHLAAEVDISAFDLAKEWDSIGAILDFVTRHAPATLDQRRRAG